MAERLVLVGMMGVGKTTVGQLAARTLGWRFVDLDREVERVEGSTVAEIFASRGEPAFRRAEQDALSHAFASPDDVVVSAGGGVVLDPENRAVLEEATVVWLKAGVETLESRLGAQDDRPLLRGSGDRRERLADLADERESLYRDVAGSVVDVDDLSPAEVASLVVACVRGAGPR